jgi:hypothetical protein
VGIIIHLETGHKKKTRRPGLVSTLDEQMKEIATPEALSDFVPAEL